MAKQRKFRIPIMVKTAILIVTFAFIIVFVSMGYFATSITANNRRNYETLASSLATTTAEVIDPVKFKNVRDQICLIIDNSEDKPAGDDEEAIAKWNEDLSRFQPVLDSQDYKDLLEVLQNITTANEEKIDCAYLSFKGGTDQDPYFVYAADGASEDACQPGCLDVLYDINRGILTDPSRGFPPYSTDTPEYGWLLTAGTAVYNGERTNENVVGYAMIDISMNTVRASQVSQIMTLFAWLMGSVVLISVLGVVIISFILVKPIMKLKAAANNYNTIHTNGEHNYFSNLKVRTYDEITDLAESMQQMERDINEHISELTEMNRALEVSHKETEEMSELAKRDGLTGVHNKISYDADIEELNAEIKAKKSPLFGIAMIDLNYLKTINDTNGHKVGDDSLKKLVKAICSTFHRYRVYRVGGDEFVVIIRNIKEDKVKVLIKQFYEKIDELNQKEFLSSQEISAAIGYAQFDEKHDQNVDDVYKRADRTMYYNKFEMKKHDKKQD